jgi:CRP/FNR family transcriptional regulator
MDEQWHLSESDFFEGLEQAREDFLLLASSRVCKRNDFVFLEGQPGEHVYYIAKGGILIFRTTSEGKEPIMSVRHPGEVFGLAEVLGRHERKCNAQALSDAVLRQIHADDLESLLARHYPLARRVIEVLGRRVRQLNEQVESLMVLDVPTRLLKALFHLCYPHLVQRGEWQSPVVLPMRLTQEQIASLTGSCQQTISESLKQLEREGWLVLDARRITIVSPLAVIDRLSL